MCVPKNWVCGHRGAEYCPESLSTRRDQSNLFTCSLEIVSTTLLAPSGSLSQWPARSLGCSMPTWQGLSPSSLPVQSLAMSSEVDSCPHKPISYGHLVPNPLRRAKSRTSIAWKPPKPPNTFSHANCSLSQGISMVEKLEEVPSCWQYHTGTEVWLNRTATYEIITTTLFTEASTHMQPSHQRTCTHASPQ